MEGLSFGELMNAMAEPETRSPEQAAFYAGFWAASPLLGLGPAIGAAEVGHAEVFQRPANIDGKLVGILAVILNPQDDVPAEVLPDFRLGEQLGEPA